MVETGVRPRVNTLDILDALERNGTGRLISLDIPPLAEPWYPSSAELIPSSLRHRFEYRRGSVRRVLPKLLCELESRNLAINLHLADRVHTARNIEWEIAQVLSSIQSGGTVVVVDVVIWAAEHPHYPARTIVRHASEEGAFALIGP